MDKELIEYFERKFNAIDERFGQIDERFGQIDERFGQIDERFGQIDERFGQIDERFGQMDERLGQMDERFEGVETDVRHTRVLVEDLRNDLKGVAEGVVNVDEKLDRYIARADRQREEDQAANRVFFSHQQGRLEDHETRISHLESSASR